MSFQWESKQQEKAYGAYLIYLRKAGLEPAYPPPMVDAGVAFLLQRQHEANEWIIKTLADQVDRLTREIASLKEIVAAQLP